MIVNIKYATLRNRDVANAKLLYLLVLINLNSAPNTDRTGRRLVVCTLLERTVRGSCHRPTSPGDRRTLSTRRPVARCRPAAAAGHDLRQTVARAQRTDRLRCAAE